MALNELETKGNLISTHIFDDIHESIHHVKNIDSESVYSSLTSISNKLKKRNMLIRIADKSEAGWLGRDLRMSKTLLFIFGKHFKPRVSEC